MEVLSMFPFAMCAAFPAGRCVPPLWTALAARPRAPRLSRLAAWGLLAGLLSFGLPAAAQVCLVASTSPTFSAYSGAVVSGVGNVRVTCTTLLSTNVAFTVNLDMGGNASGTQRRMALLGNYLKYALHCTSGSATSWVDGNNGSCNRTGGQAGLLGTLVANFPVYADIPKNQVVMPGAYADTVQVNVLY
jgi:spore coat protein U-like protein